jgi:hypothetical protein
MARFAARLAATGIVAAICPLAAVQAAQVEALEVRLFLQDSGTFSAPIAESAELWNVIIGNYNDDDTRPSSSTFVRVQVSGPSGSYNGRDFVTLIVVASVHGRRVRQNVFRKQLGVFGKTGKQYVGFWLPNTGCEELALVARVSSDSRSIRATVPFVCGE